MSLRRIARPGIPGVVLIDDGPAYARAKSAGPRGSALRDAIPPALAGLGGKVYRVAEEPKVAEKK